MEQIRPYEPQALPSLSRPFWGNARPQVQTTNSPTFSERVLLAAGLWTMLALVAMAVLVSRYLLPVLLAVSVAVAATLRLTGLL